MKRRSSHILMAAGARMHLPPELLAQETRLTFSGQYGITIENYRKILLYSDSHIRLLFVRGGVDIYGDGLHMTYYVKEELHIAGRIRQVLFSHDEHPAKRRGI